MIEIFKKGALRDLPLLLKKPTIATGCRIRAHSDVEAMERWLDEYFDKPTTFRTYKKEAERFLVWCAHVRGHGLAQLNRDDVEAYIAFVKDPQPRHIWCGPRKKKMPDGERVWYPFTAPLSEPAIKTALASLNSMMSYLVDARYIDFNPFALVRKKNRFKPKIDEQGIKIVERILTHDEWQMLWQVIDSECENDQKAIFKKNRLRFLVSILFFLGLRIDELARARFCDCRKLNDKWWFFVRGKGDRLGKIPINSHLLQIIMQYRHSLGMTPVPTEQDNRPLIFSLSHPNDSLSTRQISNLIKEVACKAAHKFPQSSLSFRKLLKFSPHWLRHLSASRQDLAGISFTNIKSNLRHQNEQTTRIYVHAYDEERHKEMEKLTLSFS